MLERRAAVVLKQLADSLSRDLCSMYQHCEQIDGATTLCLYLLRAHKVALVTGEGFGYPKGVRLSYATSMEDLTTALDQFESCLLSLK
jgi:aspartate/methionine/tyrosine aminotransferase